MAKKQKKHYWNEITVLLLLVIVFAFLFNRFNNSFVPPVPLTYKLTSPYGNRNGTLHNGIDIGAPTGTQIKAPAGGKAKVFYSDLGGNQITIEHPNGIKTGFAHLNKTLIKDGQNVAKGQIIGEVGNTGFSTGAHLHFTMFDTKKGTWINPANYFKYA